MYHFKKIMP